MERQENSIGPVTRQRADSQAAAARRNSQTPSERTDRVSTVVADTPATDTTHILPLLRPHAFTPTTGDTSTLATFVVTESTPARKRGRPPVATPHPEKKLKTKRDEESPTPSSLHAAPTAAPPSEKFTPKQLIVGTYHSDPISYLTIGHDGITFHFSIGNGTIKPVCLKYESFVDYMICESTNLPVMLIRGDLCFGERIRKAIPTLRTSESSTMSSQIYDIRSIDRAHWYIIMEMNNGPELIDLTCKIMSGRVETGGTGRLNVPKSITVSEVSKKIKATKIVSLKWNELQLGSWKSQSVTDNTVLVSGNRMKFKVNRGDNTADVMLSINYGELSSVLVCTHRGCPVMLVRASESFGWSARERLGMPSTFQHGKDYYSPDYPETRFQFVTFKLNPLCVTDETWHELLNVFGDRRSHIEHLSSADAEDTLHKLLYQPIKCDSVRVGANELDDLKAVTIHSDSLYLCGCMLDSVVTMQLCIGDISEISFCPSEKLPVIFVKTTSAIRDTLKRNMATRAPDVFFDPCSSDVRTQYIVLELAKTTTKEQIDKVASTIRHVLSKFAGRPGRSTNRPVPTLTALTQKKSQNLLTAIKQPLQAKGCPCGKKVDVKRQEEIKQYLQSMVNKHGCGALEKMAERVIDLEKKVVCSVCLDKDCRVAFSCGHSICESCDLNLRRCHICRTKIHRRVKIFL